MTILTTTSTMMMHLLKLEQKNKKLDLENLVLLQEPVLGHEAELLLVEEVELLHVHEVVLHVHEDEVEVEPPHEVVLPEAGVLVVVVVDRPEAELVGRPAVVVVVADHLEAVVVVVVRPEADLVGRPEVVVVVQVLGEEDLEVHHHSSEGTEEVHSKVEWVVRLLVWLVHHLVWGVGLLKFLQEWVSGWQVDSVLVL